MFHFLLNLQHFLQDRKKWRERSCWAFLGIRQGDEAHGLIKIFKWKYL